MAGKIVEKKKYPPNLPNIADKLSQMIRQNSRDSERRARERQAKIKR